MLKMVSITAHKFVMVQITNLLERSLQIALFVTVLL
jgi:hypothetical protein